MDNRINSFPTDPQRDDSILSVTRLLAGAVIPFLVAAFLILYLSPEDTANLFAWSIASPLTTSLMGAGYLGGAYFFARVLAGDNKGVGCRRRGHAQDRRRYVRVGPRKRHYA